MSQIKTIKDVDLKGKKVFVRVDFNVPFDSKGEISDDTRIVAALPTINYLIDEGAKVVLTSHLGRPKSKADTQFSLAPVAKALSEKLGKPVTFVDDCIGDKDSVVGEPAFQSHAPDFFHLMVCLTVGEDCQRNAPLFQQVQDSLHGFGNVQMLLMFPVNVLEFQRLFFCDFKAKVSHGVLHAVYTCAVHGHGSRHNLVKDPVAVDTGCGVQFIHIYIIFILPYFLKSPLEGLCHIVQGFVHVKYHIHILSHFSLFISEKDSQRKYSPWESLYIYYDGKQRERTLSASTIP